MTAQDQGGVSDFDDALDRRLADGSLTLDDATTIRDFAAFLSDPKSRCAICLSDDLEGAGRREHSKLGLLMICRLHLREEPSS